MWLLICLCTVHLCFVCLKSLRNYSHFKVTQWRTGACRKPNFPLWPELSAVVATYCNYYHMVVIVISIIL